MSETKKRNPVTTGVLIAVVGLVIALLLGLVLMKIVYPSLASASVGPRVFGPWSRVH